MEKAAMKVEIFPHILKSDVTHSQSKLKFASQLVRAQIPGGYVWSVRIDPRIDLQAIHSRLARNSK